jgi:hypothetical protein
MIVVVGNVVAALAGGEAAVVGEVVAVSRKTAVVVDGHDRVAYAFAQLGENMTPYQQ